MDAIAWAAVALAGLTAAALASTRAVDHAVTAAAGFGIPTFVIGFTLVAIGTDLPEIANSIVASLSGHGDINVGDSIGSAAAQSTLVIGLVPLLAHRISVTRRNVGLLGGSAVMVLAIGAVLMADGALSRVDGIVLVAAWAIGLRAVHRRLQPAEQPRLPMPEQHPLRHGASAILWLLVVAAGATLAVVGLTEVATAMAVPEYLVSFLGLALGTSLPELVVAVTAARHGEGDLALGDALGATFADASLSVGIGPIIAPTAVTASLVVRGALSTAIAVALVTTILVLRGRHTRVTGVLFVLVYLAMIPVIVGG